jgi:UDP-N-acetyl-D-glucosamine dehydrogenase
VPTPLRKTQDPDISYIIASCERIKNHIKKGAVVVLESTTYPGTTREVVRGILERKNFRAGKDFFLAFSPERIDPSNEKWNVKNTPKVIGGINKASLDKAVAYYSLAIKKIVPATSLEAAEMVKLLENTFRAVNIGLINEMAQIADRLGLDVWEIVKLAASKPYGFMPFYPGPGLGGHCIPIDPLYLSWKMKSLNFYTRFIDLASEINGAMPHFTVMKLAKILNGFSKSVKGSRIIILGVAYKKDVSDTRESPAFELISELEEMGADVRWFDDLIVHGEVPGTRLKKLSPDVLKKADMLVVACDHSHFDYDFIEKNSKRIFDLRNTFEGKKSAKIFKL